jgi:hypothetical protein
MPLRDHFRPPLKKQSHWESFHSSWANTIVRHLNARWLPIGYRAEPQVKLGTQIEVDAATFERTATTSENGTRTGGTATALWAPSRPTATVAVELQEEATFEVRVYDEERDLRLVGAVELVSPANKNRPSHRQTFLSKCAGYLREGVGVVVLDAITERRQNLHNELLEMLGTPVTEAHLPEPSLYAVAYRTVADQHQVQLEMWTETLAVGTVLPILPLWLAASFSVPIEFEATYLETFEVLRLT